MSLANPQQSADAIRSKVWLADATAKHDTANVREFMTWLATSAPALHPEQVSPSVAEVVGRQPSHHSIGWALLAKVREVSDEQCAAALTLCI